MILYLVLPPAEEHLIQIRLQDGHPEASQSRFIREGDWLSQTGNFYLWKVESDPQAINIMDTQSIISIKMIEFDSLALVSVIKS